MEEVSKNTSLPEEESPPSEKETEQKTKEHSKEPLFGLLLLGAIVVFLLLAAAGIGWAVYGGVSKNQAENRELSIAALGQPEDQTGEAPESTPMEDPAPPASSPQAATEPAVPIAPATKNTVVRVLNGGAAKGSAGKLAESIKQDGYTQVSAGDATGNYTGVVIYYAESLAKEAELLKASVVKMYPSASTAQASAANRETAPAPLTVIIGT